jgi:hypothetical protein
MPMNKYCLKFSHMLSRDVLPVIVRYTLEAPTRQFRGYLANKEGILPTP